MPHVHTGYGLVISIVQHIIFHVVQFTNANFNIFFELHNFFQIIFFNKCDFFAFYRHFDHKKTLFAC